MLVGDGGVMMTESPGCRAGRREDNRKMRREVSQQESRRRGRRLKTE